MNYKDVIYSVACMAYTIVIGGAVYEHLAVVPRWSAAPPLSLSMFQGEYGLNPGPFWTSAHPITLVCFIAALVVSWKSTRKINLLIVFIGYVVILATTAVYFVPELMSIVNTPYSTMIDKDLIERSKLWETLSLVRLGVMIILGIYLFLGLTKISENNIMKQ